ncbi:MAG: DMT family transporter [Candidatus Geothermincolia bacterium]
MTATTKINLTWVSYVLVLLSVGLAISGQLCLRRGMEPVKAETGMSTKELIKQPLTFVQKVLLRPLVFLGLLLFVASAMFWLVVLADIPLGVAYPFVSLTYIIVLAYDWKFETYNINVWNWLGIAAIVSGVFMISAGRK